MACCQCCASCCWIDRDCCPAAVARVTVAPSGNEIDLGQACLDVWAAHPEDGLITHVTWLE